jgi:hypothetical protein
MSELTFSEARARAWDAIAHMAEEQRLGDLMIVDEAIVETDAAWYFPYDATAFVKDGRISAALAGNLPVKVLRDGTAISYETPMGSA